MRTALRWGSALVGIGLACGGGRDDAESSAGATSSGAIAESSSGNSGTSGVDGSTDAGPASASESGTTGAAEPYPPPDGWGPNHGPGGPAVPFDDADLFVNCAYLTGGRTDFDHHNLVVMFDGYLLLPWAPEFSLGGISMFDVSDPCAPQLVGAGTSDSMRETHSLGFASHDDRWYAVVNQKRPGLLQDEGGIQFWDLTDPTAPTQVADLELPGFAYPDAYARVTLSVFWQVPWVYVAGADNGVYIVDASDPTAPVLAAQHHFDPTLRAGQLQVVGDWLFTTAAEGPRTVVLDVSVPDVPQPIAGADIELVDGDGVTREAYFANIGAGLMYYAVKNGDGGLLVYDVHDPGAASYAGHFDSGGNGGYVFVKGDLAFVGESDFATMYDVADPSAITPLAQLDLEGDLDTITPIGNVAVLSVDEDAVADQASAIAPYATAVDAVAPRVVWSVPSDGANDLAPTSRIGVVLDEMIDVKSAWAGSVRVYLDGVDPALGRVDGHVSAQENIVNFSPLAPLEPGATYVLEIPAGGIVDYNGNAIEEAFSISFTIAG
ncbi:MAG TPA: Ig-like domain-containing protein [Nannocystaceae bacterium]|nr:Ig-like domain-containing protein [Nannocystaceae bacterium]